MCVHVQFQPCAPNTQGRGGAKMGFSISWKLYKIKAVVNLPSRSVYHVWPQPLYLKQLRVRILRVKLGTTNFFKFSVL